jgi:hypothetical protein
MLKPCRSPGNSGKSNIHGRIAFALQYDNGSFVVRGFSGSGR